MDNNTLRAHHNYELKELIDLVTHDPDLTSDETTTAIKNVVEFSKIQMPDPDPEPIPAPTTRWGKFRAGAAAALDNETTRALIKAGGSFAAVGVVVWSTVHRDHVLDRTALQQANQRPS